MYSGDSASQRGVERFERQRGRSLSHVPRRIVFLLVRPHYHFRYHIHFHFRPTHRCFGDGRSVAGCAGRCQHLWVSKDVCMYVCMYEQRYRQAVRDSQESLCILLSEEMDLQLQQQVVLHTYIVHTYIHIYSNRNGLCNVSQILSNKMHSLFVSIAKAYASEQTNMLIEAHSFLKEVLGSAIYL